MRRAKLLVLCLLAVAATAVPIVALSDPQADPSPETDASTQLQPSQLAVDQDCSSCHNVESYLTKDVVHRDRCGKCHTNRSGVGSAGAAPSHSPHENTTLGLLNVSQVPSDHKSFSDPAMLDCQRCHNDQGLACEDCHGQHHKGEVPDCQSCHDSLTDLPTHAVSPLGKKHKTLGCQACHSKDSGKLTDVMGDEIDFNRTDKKCGSCHRRARIDWENGNHHVRGFYSEPGVKGVNMSKAEWATNYSCTKCHNAHAPNATNASTTIQESADDGGGLVEAVKGTILGWIDAAVNAGIGFIASRTGWKTLVGLGTALLVLAYVPDLLIWVRSKL